MTVCILVGWAWVWGQSLTFNSQNEQDIAWDYEDSEFQSRQLWMSLHLGTQVSIGFDRKCFRNLTILLSEA